MSRYVLIDLSWNEKELDIFFRENYHLRLIDFAFILVEAFLGGLWPRSNLLGFTKTSIQNELKYIDKLRNDLLNDLRLYCEKFPVFENYDLSDGKEERQQLIIKNFGLSWLLRYLEEREIYLSSLRYNDLGKGAGRSMSIRSQINVAWASLMRTKNQVPWSNIVMLLRWFYEHLCDTEYGKHIYIGNPLKKEREHLRKVYKSNVEILRKSRKSEKLKQKRFETFKETVALIRAFPNIKKSRPIYLIKFEKHSIEVMGKIDENLRGWKISFINGKRYFSTFRPPNGSSKKKSSSIMFPQRKKE